MKPFPFAFLVAIALGSLLLTPASVQSQVRGAVPPAATSPPVTGVTPPDTRPLDYVIGPLDVLNIAVWNQNDVSGRYTVEQDGSFTFPLLGRIKVADMTLRGLELELTKQLGADLFKDPQVTVSVAEYKSKQVFVVGEVRQPGTHSLSGSMRLIEALARAGSTTSDAADYLLVVRTAHAQGPVLPGQDAEAEVIRVDLRSLQDGAGLSQNIVLRDSDTVYVPRAAMIFVYGSVRNPGSYAIGKATTVLQALSLAGGVNEFGAANRIKIVRRVGTKETEVKGTLDQRLEPGDTIIVPERLF